MIKDTTPNVMRHLFSISKSILLYAVLFVFNISSVYAQPANDQCSGAIALSIANNEQSIVWTSGTTKGTIDASFVTGPATCSLNSYRDDVWYKLTIPLSTTHKIITIRIDDQVQEGMNGVGLAVYLSNSCQASNEALLCTPKFNEGQTTQFRINMQCFTPGQEILIRVWSSDGTELNWQLGEGNFKIAAFYEDGLTSGKILWGANGEGSFNGGLNGWTTTSNSCLNYPLWVWSKDSMCTKGAFSSGGGKINSSSICNGAACFDSDFYDNGGLMNNIGFGPCPAPQSGTLESPTIDLSSFPLVNGVNLVFSQALRQYQSSFFVEYSIDNGNNWSTIQINTPEEDNYLYGLSGPFVNNTRNIFLPGAAGSSQLKVRFRLEADYYYWIIDDVFITEREAYNIKLDNSFAIAPNKIWQRDQLYGFGGLAEVANIGAKTAKNVNLKLEITDPDNSVVWIGNKNFGAILADTAIDILLDNDFIHPNVNVGNYTANYSVKQDSIDFDNADNNKSFDWEVSSYRMAKENIGANGYGLRPTTDVNFTWGNIFHIVTPISSNGKADYRCHEVEVGIANPNELAGGSILAWIFKWNNINHDSIAQEDERITIGYNQYDFTSSELPNTLFTLPILDFTTFDEGIDLEPNTDYIVAVQYSAPADQPDLACYVLSDPNINYDYTTLRTKLINPGATEYNHILDIGNTGTFSAATFASGAVPVVRMLLSNGDSISGYASSAKGKVFLDFNCDGIFNGEDKYLENKIVYNTQGDHPETSTNTNGYYYLHLKDFETQTFYTKPFPGYNSNPINYTIVNDTLDKFFTGYDFRFCPDSLFHNVKVNIVALEPPRPGFNHKYRICYENLGTQTENVVITFDFTGGQGDAFTSILDADGGTINGHTISWNIADLALFEEDCKEITLLVNPSTPLDTQLSPHVSISLAPGLYDANTSDNDERLNEKVVGSYDPNDKNVSKEGFTASELEKGVSLDYQIRFQNTGTYPATFIDVYDTLVKTLDIRTFEMISASHPYTLTFPADYVLKWRFDNINLADSTNNEPESHGYIKFRIKTTPNLSMSDVISNSAAIYFDFNTPIITNSIKTSFVTATHSLKAERNLPLEVYPNPVSNVTQVRYNLIEKMNCRLELMDPTGKIVLIKGAERPIGEQAETIDMSDYASGIYFLRIYTEKGMGEAKIVKK